MEQQEKSIEKWLGALLIGAGIAVNKWSLGWTFAADGEIAGGSRIALIAGFQAILIIAGILSFSGRIHLRPVALAKGATLMLGFIVIFGFYQTWQPLRKSWRAENQTAVLEKINRSEDLIQWITVELRALNRSMMNVKIPDIASHELFASEVSYKDIAKLEEHAPGVALSVDFIKTYHGVVDKEVKTAAPRDLSLWRPLLNDVDYIEHAKFKVIKGSFLDAEEKSYEVEMGASGLAMLKTGKVAYFTSKQKVLWKDHSPPNPSAGEQKWLIHNWKMKSLNVMEVEDLLLLKFLTRLLGMVMIWQGCGHPFTNE